jgi:CHAT domain-containing protein
MRSFAPSLLPAGSVPVVVLGLVLAVACAGPATPEGTGTDTEEISWAQWAERLRDCPESDGPWRAAMAAAQKDEALDAFTEAAIETGDRFPDRWEPVWAAGESLFRQRRLPDAEGHLRAALDRARAAPDSAGIACAGNRLGAVRYHAGDHRNAEALYLEALDAARAAERRDLVAFVHNNLAGLRVETGDFVVARENLELAEQGLLELGLEGPSRVAAYNRAVLTVVLGDATAGGEAMERVHDQAQAAQDAYMIGASAVVLGNLHRTRGRTAEALEWYDRVVRDAPGLATRAELGRGRVALLEDRFDEASRIFAGVAERATEQVAQIALLARTFRADADMRAGRTAQARQALVEVIEESDRTEASETAWAGRWILGKLELGEGNADAAVGQLEEAVAILDRQVKPLNPLSGGMHFLRERADPYVDLAVAVAERGPPGPDTAARILEIAGRAKARALRRAIHGQEGSEPIDLGTLRHGLAGGELLLEYLLGEDHGLVLAVTRDETHSVTIPGRNALLEPLSAYRSSLLQPAPEGAADARRSLAGRLGEQLLGPVGYLVSQAKRVYVVPDRDLALLPFAALRLRGGPHLGAVVEVAMMPMAGLPPAWNTARGPVLLAGRPELDEGSGFPELAWAGFELSKLREIWGDADARYVGGADFTAAQLGSMALGDFRTVHLATHAVASTHDPRRCGVILSHGERLGLEGIVDLDLDGSLVVLSACRTGEGELLPGEGVVGLGWAFLRAGALGVVVTLWSVDDEASARLMVAFHRRLRDGVEPVRALSEARREMASDGADPSTWAPFAIVLSPTGS